MKVLRYQPFPRPEAIDGRSFPARDLRPVLVKGLCILLVTLTSTALLVTACSRSKSARSLKLSPRVVEYGQPVPKGGGRYKVGSPYKVNGRWYRPQHDPTYDRVGVASWYGELFHGRYTANGEIYDMDALSAAHPTLPMPVYVRVTNLSNGRSVVVRVNDRGPYAQNRVIDLSRRTATLLGFKRQGTARVRVKYLKDAPLSGDDSYERQALAREPWSRMAAGVTAPASVASITPARPRREAVRNKVHFVQVASFRNQDDADRARRDLAKLGPVAVYPAEIDGTVWYRVRMGPFTTKKAASKMQERLDRGGTGRAQLVEN